jgi:protocatechuate 3,4-dioxygenase beta subunit
MTARGGCGRVALGCLFVLVVLLVFVALAGALVLTGEVSLYAPRLTGFEPDPNEPFRPTTAITLTFDQPMDPASVAASFALVPDVPGSFAWDKRRTHFTFVPDPPGYEPGREYRVRLAPGVQAGTLPRTTQRGFETTISLQPLLDAQSPPRGQADLGPLPRLEATFNYALDCALTLRTFTMTPSSAGTLECRDRTLAFNPTQPLAPGTAYTASFVHVFLEDDPSLRPGVEWSFTTAAPLTIVDVSPAAAGFLMDLWAPMRITFNRPVVADSARFSLVAADGSPVAGRLSWEDDGATLVFQPDRPLNPATEYRFSLQQGVEDELGFKLADGLSHTFATLAMLGLPLPVPGTEEVPLDSSIRVPFTRPMDRASVEAGLTITPSLDADTAWEEDTLVLTPRGGLAADTIYELVLGPDVRDASGAPLGVPRRWTFGTQSFLLNVAVPSGPALTELRQPIEFTFALPMDRGSVQAALAISPTTTGQLVWRDDDRIVTFQPDPAWLSGVDYEISLAGTARAAGTAQTLGEDRAWAFTTAVAEVRFGEGPNAQVMNAAGDLAFQFISRGADVVDFRLYPITPTQFLDLYSSGFRGIGPDEPQIVHTDGLTPTVVWRENLQPLDGERYDNWQPAEAHMPAEAPPGMYVLAAGPPAQDQGQLLVVLTRHVLVLKQALAGSGSSTQAQIVAWDTELGTGAPVVSATVRLYDRDGTFLAEGLSDADGLLTLDVPGDPGPLLALSFSPSPTEGIEGTSGDVTVCGLGNEWSAAGWWWWWTQPTSRPLYTIYTYTDRPIYRPGQTVYFKVFVRADEDVSYTLPAPDLPVTVRLRDARDNVAATQVLTPTAFGTVHGAFQLADEPMLGTWNLETEAAGAITRQPLKVEEYRKPEYEVTVSTPQKTYVAGKAISVTVDAAYYFGQPVAGAAVELAVYQANPDFYYEEGMSSFGYPISTESDHMDAGGQKAWLVSTDELFSPGDEVDSVTLALEATVTDDTGQSVSSYQTVVVRRASQGLTLFLEQYGYEPAQEIAFAAQVLDGNGEPVASTELAAQVLGWDDAVVREATATTDARGLAHFSVALADQGWYQLQVRGMDDGGRTMETREWLWVYDPGGQAAWYQGRWNADPALSISADRATYRPGDVARLVVHTPMTGPALLSFERGETHRAEPVTLISGTNLITVPIRPDYAPNIYVSVSQFGPLGEDWWPEQSWPEAELHTASTQLLVPMDSRRLTVTLDTDGQTYRAGDEATFHVQVTDSEGQPVVAEVSLAVVDEAIYALAKDLSADPFQVFYGPRSNGVRSFDSQRLSRWLFPESPGMGGGDGDLGGAPRRTFLDTAYWAPTVVTGEDGRATITFTLPDNLTEWRALARAVTTDTLVGQATMGVVVSQDIVVRPALPRFLVQGDAITLTAVVHNFTTQAVSATVDLGLVGLRSPVADAQRVIHLPAADSTTVGWPVVAEEPGEAQVTVEAVAGVGARVAGRDVVELPLVVHPLVVPEVATFAGALSSSRPTDTVTVTLPSDAIEGLSRMEINLAPSIAPGLLQGLEYLIDYPFG